MKKVDYAVVPFENSTNGQVVFTYDLLRDWYFQTSTPPKFRIIAEQFVSIHHNLLTNASKIEDIKLFILILKYGLKLINFTKFTSTNNEN